MVWTGRMRQKLMLSLSLSPSLFWYYPSSSVQFCPVLFCICTPSRLLRESPACTAAPVRCMYVRLTSHESQLGLRLDAHPAGLPVCLPSSVSAMPCHAMLVPKTHRTKWTGRLSVCPFVWMVILICTLPTYTVMGRLRTYGIGVGVGFNSKFKGGQIRTYLCKYRMQSIYHPPFTYPPIPHRIASYIPPILPSSHPPIPSSRQPRGQLSIYTQYTPYRIPRFVRWPHHSQAPSPPAPSPPALFPPAVREHSSFPSMSGERLSCQQGADDPFRCSVVALHT